MALIYDKSKKNSAPTLACFNEKSDLLKILWNQFFCCQAQLFVVVSFCTTSFFYKNDVQEIDYLFLHLRLHGIMIWQQEWQCNFWLVDWHWKIAPWNVNVRPFFAASYELVMQFHFQHDVGVYPKKWTDRVMIKGALYWHSLKKIL